jgi:hypothetical protein
MMNTRGKSDGPVVPAKSLNKAEEPAAEAMERSMLSDLWKSSEQRTSESARAQNDSMNFAPRYFSTACRDLHRIDRYMDLKKNKL